MKCQQCNNKMEDTKGTSFGTGERIFRCKECGWTAVESACTGKPKEVVKPEGVFHHGIKYSDYKAVIEITGADGGRKVKFTTWRADIITTMMKAGLVLQAFEPDDVFTVKAAPNKEKLEDNKYV